MKTLTGHWNLLLMLLTVMAFASYSVYPTGTTIYRPENAERVHNIFAIQEQSYPFRYE